MKKIFLNMGVAIAFLSMISLSSCYTYSWTAGSGPKTGVTEQGMNVHLLYGLVDLKQTDWKTLAGDATDYKVIHEHTFVDGLLGAITFGIFTPTTTKVIK
jgi:hypothetical protein